MARLRIEEVLSQADKERIHRSAVTLLEKLGFICNHPNILDAFRDAGCNLGEEVSKPRGARAVTFTEEIIADALSKAPSRFTLHPFASGYKQVNIGSGEVYFGANGGSRVWDLETNDLRLATLSDFVTGSRLIDACANFDLLLGFPHYWAYDLAMMYECDKFGYMGAMMTGHHHVTLWETATTRLLRF